MLLDLIGPTCSSLVPNGSKMVPIAAANVSFRLKSS